FIPAFLTNKEQIPVLGFNVIVGGLFSAKRCQAAIPLNVWVSAGDVVSLSKVIVEIFRDHGLRANRQKARLIWLLDEWGIEKFRTEVEKRFGKSLLPAAAKDEIDWDKRNHLGIHKQKQAGLNYAGLNIPVGRLSAHDMLEIARLGEVYGSGEIRFTVEQNVIIPNIPDQRLTQFCAESILEKFAVNPGLLMGSLVSCTGAQFCNFALIETKNRALEMIKSLQSELTLSRPVRIHWTGCPNSCGQPQVADIGLMGTKVRKNGQMLEGVD
ncbi:MAG: ferredoxin--nitrite reductase, partial [Dolichospermum sp.]